MKRFTLRKVLFILSIIIGLSGLHLLYKAFYLENMPINGDGVGTVLFLYFEQEMLNEEIPSTVLRWKNTSIWLFVVSVLFFVLSIIVPKKVKEANS